MFIHFSAASFLKDANALSPHTYIEIYGYKNFCTHVGPANLSQLFASQIQTQLILPERPLWPQPAGGRSPAKVLRPWGALAPSLGARQMQKATPWSSDPLPAVWGLGLGRLSEAPGASEKEQCSQDPTVALFTAMYVEFICCHFLIWYNIKFIEQFQELYKKTIISPWLRFTNYSYFIHFCNNFSYFWHLK